MWVTWSYYRIEWIVYVMKEVDISLLVIFLLYRFRLSPNNMYCVSDEAGESLLSAENGVVNHPPMPTSILVENPATVDASGMMRRRHSAGLGWWRWWWAAIAVTYACCWPGRHRQRRPECHGGTSHGAAHGHVLPTSGAGHPDRLRWSTVAVVLRCRCRR